MSRGCLLGLWALVLQLGCSLDVSGRAATIQPPTETEDLADPVAGSSEEKPDGSVSHVRPDGTLPDEEDGGNDAAGDGGEMEPNPLHACCRDGDCLCHGDAPPALTADPGPFNTAELNLPLGQVWYPVDAVAPFAAVAVCGGFFDTGPEMFAWAPFFASHGIVMVVATTNFNDSPAQRADKLLAALDQLASENQRADSPLFQRLALDRMGTSGFDMGGGGTTVASVERPELRTSVALAAWGTANVGITVPTLLLCGTADGISPCAFSRNAYDGIDDSVDKMLVELAGWRHRQDWYAPLGNGSGASGKYVLAFEKVFLEGDERWLPLLLEELEGVTVSTTVR